MIRHVVLFRWRQGFDPSDWLARVRALPEQVPQLRSLVAGTDVLGTDRSWDAAVVADFENLADVAAYADHPAHRPIIAISAEAAEQIVSVDFEVPTAEPNDERGPR